MTTVYEAIQANNAEYERKKAADKLASDAKAAEDRKRAAAEGVAARAANTASLNPDETQRALADTRAATEYLRQKAAAVGPRGIPVVQGGGPVAPAVVNSGTLAGTAIQADQNVDAQRQALQRAQDAADGKTPSAAELMLQRQSARDQGAAFGLAAAGNRGSVGAALYGAQAAQTRLASDASMAQGILRAQEQATARGQLLEATGQARGQDINVGTAQAGLTQDAASKTFMVGTDVDKFNSAQGLDAGKFVSGQAVDVSKANAGVTLQGRQLDDQLGLSRDEVYQRGVLGQAALANGVDRFQLDAFIAKNGLEAAKKAARDGMWANIAGAVLTIGGGVAGAYFGGPAGAQAGASAGSAAGGVIT